MVSALDEDLTRLNFTRSQIGARDQQLDVLVQRLAEEDIELQRVLSDEIDVDLIEAISNLTARQTTIQASLQTIAQSFRLSLLDFL